MLFGRKKETACGLLVCDNEHYSIKIKKHDVNFFIKIKETDEGEEIPKYIWFLHVELPRTKTVKLCAFGMNKTVGPSTAQDEALLYLNNIPYKFYTHIKDL